MTGTVFDIQRFSVHDGPGIRTTVFMKGCPLRCGWCHNPEGLTGEIGVQFFEEECIACRRCGGIRTPDAAKNCPAGALKVSGQEMTPEDLLSAILADRDFYGTEGGVTFSGGECLLQADFVAEMLRLAKEAGITTAVDTCGFVPWESIGKTVPYTDTYLYDIKCADSPQHERFTGRPNGLILENLEKLAAVHDSIWIRVPVIPGFNDSDREMAAVAEIVSRTPGVTRVTLMPYHTLGKSKYKTLGLTPPYETETRISDADLARWKSLFAGGCRIIE